MHKSTEEIHEDIDTDHIGEKKSKLSTPNMPNRDSKKTDQGVFSSTSVSILFFSPYFIRLFGKFFVVLYLYLRYNWSITYLPRRQVGSSP